jgi:hypothetical protein
MSNKRNQQTRVLRILGLVLVMLACVACGAPVSDQMAPTPSPTLVMLPTRTPTSVAVIATAPVANQPIATPSTSATSQAISPTSVIPVIPTPSDGSSITIPATFRYLWPTYLPANMSLFKKETRIPSDKETGVDDLGFFLLTFSNGQGKIFFGGGSTDTIPLSGTEESLTVAGRPATLIRAQNQALLDISVNKGKLFLFGWNIDGDTLVQVAQSLQPIDLEVLRQVVDSHQ